MRLLGLILITILSAIYAALHHQIFTAHFSVATSRDWVNVKEPMNEEYW